MIYVIDCSYCVDWNVFYTFKTNIQKREYINENTKFN